MRRCTGPGRRSRSGFISTGDNVKCAFLSHSYTPEGGVPRARRIFRRYLPAEILTYLIINFLWAGLSLWLVSTLVSRTRVFTDREGASGGRSAATPRAQYTVTGSDSRGRLGRRAY